MSQNTPSPELQLALVVDDSIRESWSKALKADNVISFNRNVDPAPAVDPDHDYVAPRVEAIVFAFDRNAVTFSDTLCTVPAFVTITEAGQAIAYYKEASEMDPPLPYETLEELLVEHAQGCRSADYLRANLHPLDIIPKELKAYVRRIKEDDKPLTVVSYSRDDLEAITTRAKKYWGDAVQFRPRLV